MPESGAEDGNGVSALFVEREEGVGSPEWRLNPRDSGDWPRGTHEEWSAIIGALASWSFRPKGVITQKPNTLVPNQFSRNPEDGRPQEEERNRWDRIFSTGLMSREFGMSSTLFKPTPLILDCAVAWTLSYRQAWGKEDCSPPPVSSPLLARNRRPWIGHET